MNKTIDLEVEIIACKTLADPRGCYERAPVKFYLFSCSFREKNWPNNRLPPPFIRDWHPPPRGWEILDLPLCKRQHQLQRWEFARDRDIVVTETLELSIIWRFDSHKSQNKGVHRAVADVRGLPRLAPPLRPKIFSISCSFSENLIYWWYIGDPSPSVCAPSYGESWIRRCRDHVFVLKQVKLQRTRVFTRLT